jgi:hypothetical protein
VSHRALKTERRLERRRLLHAIKSKPCADCGLVFDPVCMDFDHRPGTTKQFEIGQMRERSLRLVMAEIAKCNLVCANCHRIHTHHHRDHKSLCGPITINNQQEKLF